VIEWLKKKKVNINSINRVVFGEGECVCVYYVQMMRKKTMNFIRKI